MPESSQDLLHLVVPAPNHLQLKGKSYIGVALQRTWLQVTSQAQIPYTPCLSDINIFEAFLGLVVSSISIFFLLILSWITSHSIRPKVTVSEAFLITLATIEIIPFSLDLFIFPVVLNTT